MHPVLLILLTWFALDVVVVALAFASARQNSRRRGATEMVEQPRLYARH